MDSKELTVYFLYDRDHKDHHHLPFLQVLRLLTAETQLHTTQSRYIANAAQKE